MVRRRNEVFLVLTFAISAIALRARAADDEPSKEECVEAHSQAQDMRVQGKFSLARKLFMSCAQSACPALVQADCARFADEIERVQPWLSFAARDANGNDLPETSVHVDDMLVANRVDAAQPYEVDPGKHMVRFTYRGQERLVTIVVGSAEKGRNVVGTFDVAAASTPARPGVEPSRRSTPKKARPKGARVLLGAGTVVAAAGAAIGIIGLARVPASCSLSRHECASPPGAASFEDAERAVRMSNIGWAVAGAGAAAVGGGLIWYLRSGKPDRTQLVAPWGARGGGGLSLRGRF